MTRNRTYWLLERIKLGKDGRPKYFVATAPDKFVYTTSKPGKAARWLTRTEARLARNRLPERELFRATEHIFTER